MSIYQKFGKLPRNRSNDLKQKQLEKYARPLSGHKKFPDFERFLKSTPAKFMLLKVNVTACH